MTETLLDAFAASVARNGDKVALVEGDGTRVSFTELAARQHRLAAAWAAQGMRSGDRILIAMPVGADLYATLAAIWSLGAVAVLPEPAMGISGLRNALRTPGMRGLCASGGFRALRLLLPALWRQPLYTPSGRDVPRLETHRPLPSDLALISFTSGTTGAPKAIPRSHAFLMAQHRAVAPLLDSAAEERDLVAFPVFVLVNLAAGRCSILPNWKMSKLDRVSPEALARWISDQGATRLLLPPALCETLAKSKIPPSIHTLLTGGGPVFPDLIAALKTRAPKLRIVSVYGSTEAEPIAEIAASDVTAEDLAAMASGKGLLAGRPVAATRLRIFESEIQVSGAHVNEGYLDPARDAETKVREGAVVWHRTGDAGYLDDLGRLWLLGRLGGAVQTETAPRHPFSVETAARFWPGVSGAALLALRGKAVLALTGEASRLPDWVKRARTFGISDLRPMESLPMDRRHRSKVDVAALRKRLGGRAMRVTLEHRWSLGHNYMTGVTFGIWMRLLVQNRFHLSPAYWHRVAFITLASLANSGFAAWEQRRHGRAIAAVRISRPPLFILGHWRSGTTLLHDLLAQDTAQFQFANTFRVVNPLTYLTTERAITRLLPGLVPDKRPMDNMPLKFSSPQEDEFAPLLMTGLSVYLGVSFPQTGAGYERYLSFRGVPRAEIEVWKAAFLTFCKKLSLSDDRALLLKSPPHTARIRTILELFPDARFIHIHRDPYTVFQSQRHFFDTAGWYTYLQRPDPDAIDEGILQRHETMYDAYFEDLALIPPGHLAEIRFDALESDPETEVAQIYEALGLAGFAAFRPQLAAYVAGLAGYEKNRFPPLDAPTRKLVATRWARSFAVWTYPTQPKDD